MKTLAVKQVGLIISIGMILVILTASSKKNETSDPAETNTDCVSRDSFLEVPFKEFLNDLGRYNTTHAKVVSRDMQKRGVMKKPSRMFLYSLDTLKKFICLVEEYGRMADIPSNELAIRFYYGVYEKDKIVAGQNYGSLHTLFMVPNYWDEREQRFKDTDIKKSANRVYALDSIQEKGKKGISKVPRFTKFPYSLEEIYQKDPGATIFMLDASAVPYTGPQPVFRASLPSSSPWLAPPPVINQGQLCPPNCPTKSLLDLVTGDVNY